eukprot:GCRY01001506.1.p1 GENE.GCRY01001506.1~~GCRY01001506.1.p1  ORF type:complete len:233 (+),score=60.91 GCRY01001506.1:105-701(+)
MGKKKEQEDNVAVEGDQAVSTPEKPKKKSIKKRIGEKMALQKVPNVYSPLHYFVFAVNVIFPGWGTFWGGCFHKPELPEKDLEEGEEGPSKKEKMKELAQQKTRDTVDYTLIAIIQFFTSFFLIGWAWSIWWGFLMFRKEQKKKEERAARKAAKKEEKAKRKQEKLEEKERKKQLKKEKKEGKTELDNASNGDAEASA